MDAALGAARERLEDLFEAKDDTSAALMIGLSGGYGERPLFGLARPKRRGTCFYRFFQVARASVIEAHLAIHAARPARPRLVYLATGAQ
jgi:hypothetical protein